MHRSCQTRGTINRADTQASGPNIAQAQDCCKARCCLHHNGTNIVLIRVHHQSNFRRLLANQVSERLPSSTPSSPPPSRIMPTTSDDTTSRWTRLSRLRSPRPSSRRSSSRVGRAPLDCPSPSTNTPQSALLLSTLLVSVTTSTTATRGNPSLSSSTTSTSRTCCRSNNRAALIRSISVFTPACTSSAPPATP
ncbi:hypothetical protein IG631_04686 [Alternaria alternata]|nr:hypothetical protein IG631_04686 [Alternaria alternata]